MYAEPNNFHYPTRTYKGDCHWTLVELCRERITNWEISNYIIQNAQNSTVFPIVKN